MKGHYDRTKQAETARLGCKYADQYYAATLGIGQERARDIYRCASSGSDDITPTCPFPELSGCLETCDLPKNWKLGYIAGRLTRQETTLVRHPDFIDQYICLNCDGVIKIKGRYCLRCGARVK